MEGQPRNHFVEWLSAILLYESTGYLSLIEKYQFGKYRRKQRIVRELMSNDLADWSISNPRPCQGPDLLAYLPDHRDWFFVEVKGPNDRLRAVQKEYFTEIEEKMNRPVFTVRFREVGGRVSA